MTLSYSGYNLQIKLSPEALLEISQEINREFAPGISTGIPSPDCQYKLSPKEMLDISEEIRLDFAPRASNNPQELVLLPVDPDHLYAYWNLGDDKPSATQQIHSGNQLTLRIYPESHKNTDITKTKSWFDVAIDSAQAQQEVLLPKWAHESTYSATIGKCYPDNSLAPFANSNISHVPAGKAMPNQFKANQIMFEPIPQAFAASLEISNYINKSASGQGNN